ncbi:MAG: DEAD/DEAH box helicase [Actinobacteria bacterium]|nr:DEAD/DEAH box helicase [Actinomycetota bacterium]
MSDTAGRERASFRNKSQRSTNRRSSIPAFGGGGQDTSSGRRPGRRNGSKPAGAGSGAAGSASGRRSGGRNGSKPAFAGASSGSGSGSGAAGSTSGRRPGKRNGSKPAFAGASSGSGSGANRTSGNARRQFTDRRNTVKRQDKGMVAQGNPSSSSLEDSLDNALDATTPIVTTFAECGLTASLVSALARNGIYVPFAIQASALPDALSGRDVLGRAQTGSGKTLAFGLPMIARLAAAGEVKARTPRGLALVPTRELAQQVADVLAPLGSEVGIRVTTVYGGVPIGRQMDRLRRGTDIVVATPGRLIDLLERRACRIDSVEITVLDEADHMADLGFLPAVTRILNATPETGQRMFFSATLDRDVERLMRTYLSDPAIHAVAAANSAVEAAEHCAFVLPAQDKVTLAAEIAARPERTLFFVRTKHGADRLAKQLIRAGIESTSIHGNLSQNQRQRALSSFAAGRPRVLVATDVAARGIHVDDVSLVVHFDPPSTHKDYLHRSGRTARAGASGMVVAFVEPSQVRDVERMHDTAGVTARWDRIMISQEVCPVPTAIRQSLSLVCDHGVGIVGSVKNKSGRRRTLH